MQTPREVFDAVRDRVTERGAQAMPEGVIVVAVGNNRAYLPPPDFDRLLLTFPAQRAGAALVALADFAREASDIRMSTRLTTGAKDEDVAKLARETRPKLEEILAEVDRALEAATLELARETAPVPIEPAAAADAVLDGELRGMLRQMAPADAMKRVRDDMASCRALLRLPVGFEPQLVDFARECWARFNPNAPTATRAQEQESSWREARSVVGRVLAALAQLAYGRQGAPATPAAAEGLAPRAAA